MRLARELGERRGSKSKENHQSTELFIGAEVIYGLLFSSSLSFSLSLSCLLIVI